jgi:hypothetical protein
MLFQAALNPIFFYILSYFYSYYFIFYINFLQFIIFTTPWELDEGLYAEVEEEIVSNRTMFESRAMKL